MNKMCNHPYNQMLMLSQTGDRSALSRNIFEKALPTKQVVQFKEFFGCQV